MDSEHEEDFDIDDNEENVEEIPETEDEKSNRVINICSFILNKSKKLYNPNILNQQNSLSNLYDLLLPLVK